MSKKLAINNTKKTSGFAAQSIGKPLEPYEFEIPALGPWDILVDITHCGICHSDLHLIENDWNNSIYPLVAGHEIIGIVKETGKLVTELQCNDRIGIGWQRSSCGCCEWCHSAQEQLCLKQEPTCVGHFGGFAKQIVIDSRFAFLVPEQLPSEYAAPLLCGGATVFSPLLSHQVDATKKIGILGIGGLGHLAIQFAAAFGAEVFVFSSSSKKKQEALNFGAHHFIHFENEQSLSKFTRSLDLLLFTSSGNAPFQSFLQLLRPKGTLCILGAPKEGIVSASPQELILERKSIDGSNIASPCEIRLMFEFAVRHHVVPKIEIFPMKEVNTALNKLRANEIHYRAVLINR